MRIVYSRRFLHSLEAATSVVRKAFFKQLAFLEQDLHYPSLHTKKYQGATLLWQARVNRDWRFYFTIEGAECHLHEIKQHPK